MTRHNIVLIGFMGSGKTVVGKSFSRMTGRRMTDTDAEIEKAAGMTVAQIFDTKGEAEFRRLEAEIVHEISSRKNQVIATGGGVIKNEENMRRLKESGVVFYLRATEEKLYANTSDSQDRPLLNVPNRMARIRELLAEREPIYLRYADHIIDTTELNVQETANALADMYP